MTADEAAIPCLGILGAGAVVELFHLPALAAISGLRIAWICDLDLSRAKRVARAWAIPAAFTRIEDCPDVDAVLIATPVGSRGELVASALGRGWHCFCEKPFAPSLTEHGEILAQAAELGRLVGSAYPRRFYWSTRLAKRLVEAECFGHLERIAISDVASLNKTGVGPLSYRNDVSASGGGVLMETGCHAIDQALYICGAREVEVSDAAQVTRLGLEIETIAHGVVGLPDGVRTPFSLVVSGIRNVYDGVVIDCSRGQVRLRDDPKAPVEVRNGPRPPVVFVNPNSGENLAQAAFRDEWLHFMAALECADDWSCPAETGWLTTAVIDQCYRLGSREGNALPRRRPA